MKEACLAGRRRGSEPNAFEVALKQTAPGTKRMCDPNLGTGLGGPRSLRAVSLTLC